MEACSLLLGRPWQYDTDSLHHGRSNHYSFMFKGQKIIIHPMTPAQIVKDDLARAARSIKQLEPSPSTSTPEIKLNAPVLLATRADFDDLRDAHLPCHALVCSSMLVSLDDAPSLDTPLRLLTFCRSTLMSFPKTCHRVFHRSVALSIRSISSPAHSFPTAPRTVRIRMRRRRSNARCRRCLTRGTSVSLLAPAQFLCHLFQRKMDHGVCV